MSAKKTTENKDRDWRAIGDSLLARGKYKDAAKAYDKAFDTAIEISPQFADAWLNKGNTLVKLSKLRMLLQRWIKPSKSGQTQLVPGTTKVLLLLGWANRKKLFWPTLRLLS